MAIPNSVLRPAVTIDSSVSVLRGIQLMHEEKAGILFAVHQNRLVGALSERDIAVRVVLRRRDPKTTPVRDVMTAPPVALDASATVKEAIQLMAHHRIRHLPVVSNGSVRGTICLRHVLQERATDLTHQMDSLVAETCADGIGG